jgi:predicted HD superfamily hydrolase involved in NAD metabolism
MALAEKYGADVEKAETAALFHDMYRGVAAEVLNDYVYKLGLDSKYVNNPNLAHGKIAARIMARDYGITDQETIDAVSFHTTGRAGMSTLEKIIYIADAIEPSRDYPGVDELREAVKRDLDLACYLSLSRTIDFVREQGKFLDTDTLEARDDFREKYGERYHEQ